MLPDEEYSYPEDFDFDGKDAFTEMSDTQTDLVARVFFTVDEAKRHVLGFKAIQIGAVKHRGSYEELRAVKIQLSKQPGSYPNGHTLGTLSCVRYKVELLRLPLSLYRILLVDR